ncbi:TetR/AcrR family transcriptional regulator [Mycobacterium sp. SP-6446]|uniref:TetR/AcrR family transcriptional regulator n=1 Tax=Mycobacterium sp. SP-6446 TaxID=1834162 RepID=UPI00096E16E5|nr:TetR/AcrR family transcriptional regulator [Mycobacterium sp. SP-6446]OMC15121.1 TetR family transcriptional regulator [Mycobacterium sp. SP-6446]
MAVTKGVASSVRPVAPRRRRAPADARREIIDAAKELLAHQPAHTVSVAAVMARTTLSRKSFYVYFRDRSELLEALVRPLRADADAALERWRTAEDPVVAGRTALASAARTYRRHSAILRAVFWSSIDDPDIEAARAGLIDPVVAVAETVIDRLGPDLADPHQTALALVTMNIHRMLTLTPETSDAELDALVDTLATIWERTINTASDASSSSP